MNVAAVERDITSRFGVPLRLSSARRPLQVAALSPAEVAVVARFANATRRRNWLLGRAALKPLLMSLGMNIDSARLRFPHPRLSLTHSGTMAIAAGVETGSITGLGVDFEQARAMNRNGARFFLKEDEHARVEAHTGDVSALLLRLWSIKEAVFKADTMNAGRALRNYRVDLAFGDHGVAVADDGRMFRYASFLFAEGALALAWTGMEE